MKTTISLAVATAASLGIVSSAAAALSLSASNFTDLTIASGGAAWDTTTFPPSNSANVYWDANTNGVFGEAGENFGNVQATLNFTISIASGVPYHFGVEGFGVAGTTGTATFLLTNTDNTLQGLTVIEGATTNFFDSNGDAWEADFEFNNSAYGNVVFNGGVGPGQGASDHQGILTFRQIPEPSSAVLFGLAGMSLVLRRRK